MVLVSVLVNYNYYNYININTMVALYFKDTFSLLIFFAN